MESKNVPLSRNVTDSGSMSNIQGWDALIVALYDAEVLVIKNAGID